MSTSYNAENFFIIIILTLGCSVQKLANLNTFLYGILVVMIPWIDRVTYNFYLFEHIKNQASLYK